MLSINEVVNGFSLDSRRAAEAPKAGSAPPLPGLPGVTGPVGTEQLFVATRTLVGRVRPAVREVAEPVVTFTDGGTTFTAVKLVPEGSAQPTVQPLAPESPEAGDEAEAADGELGAVGGDRKRPASPSGDAHAPKRQAVAVQPEGPTAVAYLCRVQGPPGKFVKERAIALGVPVGPLFGRLQTGQTVTLANGTTVSPDQVLQPADPSPAFAVVDCPTPAHLSALLQADTLLQYNDTLDTHLHAVVHFTPADVLDRPEYQAWMRRFPHTTQHIILNESHCAPHVNYRAAADSQVIIL